MASELRRADGTRMPRVSALESKPPDDHRGARQRAPRSSPLTIVSGAVAGDDLERVANSASDALGHPVAIVVPRLGAPVAWPAGAIPPEQLGEVIERAAATVGSDPSKVRSALTGPARGIVEAVPIRIGHEVVGIVATITRAGSKAERLTGSGRKDHRPWLEGAAAAAAVAVLMRDAQDGTRTESRRALLRALCAGPPTDVSSLVAQARRLGADLTAGAMALCAKWPPGGSKDSVDALLDGATALVARLEDGRVLALMPLENEAAAERDGRALIDKLAGAGMQVGVSAPRRQPGMLHEALREAMLLSELAAAPDVAVAGQEDTYRLLIGALLRDPHELELLRAHTVSSLRAYDAQHDTELLATLKEFLARHGSTTETADAMRLHRHTVGYRLARVQEVSGLSPYESDGRERLSLGLKADQILAANQLLSEPG